MIAALSRFIHKEAAAPAENVRKCEGTKLSKYKWRSQNTSRAVALPLYLLYKYIWETETKLSHAGAPLTCSHSTLAKQNGVRDKQQIGNFSWLEWQWDPIPVGVTCWPVFPIVKVEELWEWRALPGLREVTGWVTLTDGSDLPLHCLLSTLFFLWQSWTRRVYTDWLWLEEVPLTKPSQKVLNDGTLVCVLTIYVNDGSLPDWHQCVCRLGRLHLRS